MEFSTAVKPQSLYTPSWKIESNYSTRVLIGNWVEERRKVRTEKEGGQRAQREDWQGEAGVKPSLFSGQGPQTVTSAECGINSIQWEREGLQSSGFYIRVKSS